jgi:hypothetical protein
MHLGRIIAERAPAGKNPTSANSIFGIKKIMGPRLVFAIVTILSGCDPQARTATGVARADMTAGGAASRERESCSATRDCEDGLRCLDGVCAKTGSRLGDYHWAAGEAAEGKGDHGAAAQSFALALDKYPADQVPAGLLCAYGAALRRQADARTAEQSARLLHRCVLSAAPGSADYRMAMRELAELEQLGLDPTLLERDRPADSYLTKPPQRPPVDALTVSVNPEKQPENRLAVAWVAFVSSAEGKKALARCYEDYWNATRKAEAQLPLTFKYKAKFDEEEEVYVGGAMEVIPAVTLAGPEATATQCAASSLAAAATEFTRKGSGGSWQVNAMLVLSPAGAPAATPGTAPAAP